MLPAVALARALEYPLQLKGNVRPPKVPCCQALGYIATRSLFIQLPDRHPCNHGDFMKVPASHRPGLQGLLQTASMP
jgi:hypothetical protein